MIKEIIYTLKSPHRDDMRITGYKFGKGGKVSMHSRCNKGK